jgi:hypothetical protein
MIRRLIAAQRVASEFRPAEAELLDPVVGLLRERECIIEAQRPFTNIRAITPKLCARSRLAIVADHLP